MTAISLFTELVHAPNRNLTR